MDEVTYRIGAVNEVRRFTLRWQADAAGRGEGTPACVDESYWGGADRFLMAEIGGEIVGVAAYREGPPAWLDLVAVADGFRGGGVGAGLADRALARMAEMGRGPVYCRIACQDASMEHIISKSPHCRIVKIVK